MRKKFITTAIAVAALAGLAIPASADAKNGGHVRKVRMQDRCDPATFDAFFFPGVCAPHNGELVTVDEFLADLNPVTHRGIDKWNMHPDMINIKVGDSLSVSVRGGEFHTFTEVKDGFGPEGIVAGCIDFLNGRLGLTGPDFPAPPAAECDPTNPNGIFATSGAAANGGSTLPVEGLMEGTHYFMCYIHPWMQAVVTVRG